MRHRIFAAAATAVITLGLFSCDSSPTAPRLNQLTLDVVSGDGQTGVVGTEVAPLIVIVRSNGNPVSLQVLNFRVVSGGGSVYGGTELTDNNGIAQEIWTLGTNASQPQQVEVRAVESSTGAQKVFATFTATAIADRAFSVSAVAGNNQTAVAGSAVPISPAVRVADQYGNPIGGVNVTFAVGPGSGTATGLLQTTDPNGIAAVGTWTLSGTAGPNTLLATTPGVILAGRPVRFTAIGVAGTASQLVVLSGNNQAASPGAILPNQPTVRVMDANGNGVPNIAVTFTVTSGGGSIGGVGSVTTLTATGSPGVLAGSAAVNWTLGSAAGTNTLQATAVGLTGSPLVFNATVVPPPTLTSFTAAVSTITSGTSTTLTAVFSGGSGTVDHGVGAVTSGTPVSTGPLSATTTYTLTVTNSVGVSVTATVTVTVVPAPAITSFSAADPSVLSGNSTTLTAVFSGGVGAIDHGIGAVTSGTPVSTGPLTVTTTYTLTVTNTASTTASATVTVTVNACATQPSALVSWWPGEGNANDVIDGNNGTLSGGASFAPGEVGQAFLLNGVGASVDAGNAPNLRISSGDFTVEAWVFFNALSDPSGANTGPAGDMEIVDKMAPTGVNSDGWRLLKQSNNRFWFCLGGGCGDLAHTVFSQTPVQTGLWYHVAAVKTSSTFSIYVNGLQEDVRSLPNFVDTESGNLRIGSYIVEGSYLNGEVDEVSIYNRALSGQEIQAIFAAGGAGKCH